MPEENAPAHPEPDPPDPSLLRGLDPGELFARGLHTVKMSSAGGGAHGWTPPSVAEVAALFPGYEILSMLGHGGMGAVYKARQTALDRLVAIKLLPLEISIDPVFAERFRREARALAKLNHPHIVAVHDFGQTSEGQLFFAMEFVEGANLHDLIREVGLAPDQALAVAAQVCTALAYAHAKGVVHRDIKPANVMVDAESQVRVADFGLARLTDPTAETAGTTLAGTVMGTPDYMAPEQLRGLAVDHRADIYSLGVMLYEMLCRETPRGAFDLPSARTGCDPRLDAIVMKAMQPAPERRYQSTVEMKADVDSARVPIETMPAVVEPAVSAPPRAVEKVVTFVPKKNHPPLWIAFAVVLVSVLGAGGFFAKHRAKSGARSDAGPTRAATGEVNAPTATEKWVPIKLNEAVRLNNTLATAYGGSVNISGELAITGAFVLPNISSRDIAIRGEIRVPAGSDFHNIHLRYGDGLDNRYLAINASTSGRAMLQIEDLDRKFPSLSQIQLPPDYTPDKWLPFEFATVGKLSFATVQSLSFPATASEKAVQAGAVKFYGRMELRKLEIMNLDGVPEAQWPEFIRTALQHSGAQP